MNREMKELNQELETLGLDTLSETEAEALEQEERLEAVTLEIKTLSRQAGQIMLSYAIEIGKRLTEAKELVGHGNWGDYLENQVSISSSSANNFMRVYEEYGDQQVSLFDANRQAFENLSYTKALALLTLPEGEREEFVESHAVEEMSTRELQAAIKERDEARRREEEAKVEQRLAEEAKRKLEKEMTMATERAEALEKELQELKEKPVEVAVEKTVDEEALAKARKEAAEEAEKKLREEIEKEKEKAKKAADKLAKAEESAKAAQEEKERILRQKEQAQAEAEKLKKELAASGNKAVTTFGVHFNAAQAELNKMLECLEDLEKAGDAENREKLGKAYRALLDTFGEKVAG